MFFKRQAPVAHKTDEYFKYRDSLTGCMVETYAMKEFEKRKDNASAGGVMVRICGVEELPLYKGERLIKETAVIITNICKGNVFRLEYGDFLIFTEECEKTADRINYFLAALRDENRRYAVGAQRFDPNEQEYGLFMKRIRYATKIAEHVQGKTAIY